MYKNLFLLCPTDCLESVIRNRFSKESYFYTSLGNSFVYDIKTLDSIKELVHEHTIDRIYFVLSDDNQIILDALGGQFFSEIRGLKAFYNEILEQKKLSEVLWTANEREFSILSYFLNNKIKELQHKLDNEIDYPIKIGGKIFNRDENIFKDIYSDLICLEKHALN